MYANIRQADDRAVSRAVTAVEEGQEELLKSL